MLTITCGCLTLLFLILLYFKSEIQDIFHSIIVLKKIPGPPRNNIIVGNMVPLHTSKENIFKILREWASDYYPLYKICVLHKITVNILTPEDCELILSNPKHSEKSQIYDLLHNWLGTGLLTSSGNKWQSRRKILTPAFHFNVLQEFVKVFNEQTGKFVEILQTETCKNSTIEINHHITQFTLKTITETAMGTQLQFDTKKEVQYKLDIIEICEILLHRLLHPWLINKFLNFLINFSLLREIQLTKRLHKFTNEVIKQRQINFKEVDLSNELHDVYKGKRRLAMLDLLLTARNREKIIDDAGIREEVDTFMFEGHDTTSAALGFALMLIACHPDIQECLIQEMTAIMGDLRTKPSYNHLQDLKLMDRVIKEVLRLYPSVHFISRKLGEDLVTNSGYTLTKGTFVHLHIYDVHHNPQIYPDPEKFDPDRFLPENSIDRHPFAYLPFSAGPRNCIGQKFAMLELKAALCGILSKFILEPVDTPKNIILIVDIILRTKDPIRVKFIPRI